MIWKVIHRSIGTLLIIVVSVICGCSSEDQKAWEKADAACTEQSYQKYARENPDGRHVQDALAAAERLAWEHAVKEGTAKGYLDYAVGHPDCGHVEEARAAAEELSWKAVAGAKTVAAYESFLAVYPNGPHAETARQQLERGRYVPSDDVLEACLKDAIYRSMPIDRSVDITLTIDKVGTYDKQAGYLRVDGGGFVMQGRSVFGIRPDYFKVTTDGEGNWRAEFIQ